MAEGPSNIRELKHPLSAHHLGRLRSNTTSPVEFRRHVSVLSTLLVAEATADLEIGPWIVETPMESTEAWQLKGRVAAVPILRAGLAMVESLLDLIPEAEVWHLGMYRDEETARPVSYYDKLPKDAPPKTALIVDPMLATGGSASAAIKTLKDWGVSNICLLSIISAPEGITCVSDRYPDVKIYTCSIDRELNEQKFILPGLGDAGDRIFNT